MASSGGQRQTHYRLPLVSVSVCGGCWNTRMAPCLANVCLMHFEECVRTPIPRLKPSKCSVKAHRRPLLPFSTGKIKLNTFISNEKEVQITSKGGKLNQVLVKNCNSKRFYGFWWGKLNSKKCIMLLLLLNWYIR